MDKYILFIFLLITFSSCGGDKFVSPLEKKTKKPTSIQLIENGCKSGDGRSESASNVKDLISKFDIHLDTLRETQSLFIDPVSRQTDSFKSTPFKPHIMSEERIESRRQELELKFNQYIEKDNENRDLWDDLSRELKRLEGLSLRWQAQRCALSQMKRDQTKDLRIYVEILEKEDLFKCEKTKKCKRSFVKSQIDKDIQSILNLCEYYKSKSFCVSELNRQFEKPEVFYDFYINKHKKRYDQFFGLSQKRNLLCKKQEEINTLEVRVSNLSSIISRTFLNKETFDKRINEKWGIAGQFILNVTEQVPYNVVTTFKKGHLSFVNEDEIAQMTLSDSLSGNQLMDVFIHELGHVLGFVDCYIEFFDNDHKELVYYSLDRDGKNLMCEISPNGEIPTSYKESLQLNYCK